jgi:WD40 repeat protein
MRKILAFAIWCVLALVGIILVILPPRSWQCEVQTSPRVAGTRMLFSPTTNRVIHISGAAGDVTVWGDGDQPLAVYKVNIDERFPDRTQIQAQLSPDGRIIASPNRKGEVVLWDAQSGTIRHILRGDTILYIGAFSADSTKLLTDSNTGIFRVWNIRTGQVLYAFDESVINKGRFSPDGSLIVAIGAENMVQLYDAESGRLLKYFPPTDAIVNVASISPDNQRIAVGMYDGTVVIRSIATGGVNITLPQAGISRQSAMQIEFLPDNDHVAVRYSDGTIRLWDIPTAQVLYSVHTINYTYFVPAPDGKTFITPDRDTMNVWDARTGERLHTLPHVHGTPEITELFTDLPFSQYPMAFFAYSADSKRLLTIDYYDTAIWWDAQTGELIRPLCPLVLDRRWITVGVGLCAAVIMMAALFVWRMIRSSVSVAPQPA